jgi:hypothetical protein
MQNLHGNLAALSVHSARDNAVMLDLVLKTELRSERAHSPCEIRSNAAGDNKTNSAPRSLSEIHLVKSKRSDRAHGRYLQFEHGDKKQQRAARKKMRCTGKQPTAIFWKPPFASSSPVCIEPIIARFLSSVKPRFNGAIRRG